MPAPVANRVRVRERTTPPEVEPPQPAPVTPDLESGNLQLTPSATPALLPPFEAAALVPPVEALPGSEEGVPGLNGLAVPWLDDAWVDRMLVEMVEPIGEETAELEPTEAIVPEEEAAEPATAVEGEVSTAETAVAPPPPTEATTTEVAEAESEAGVEGEEPEASGEETALPTTEEAPETEPAPEAEITVEPESRISTETQAEMAAWRAKIRKETESIETPEIGSAVQAGDNLRSDGTGIRQGRLARRGNPAQEALETREETPETDELPTAPQEEHPVPEAPQHIEPKLQKNRPLPSQRMPQLAVTPRGTVPELGQRPAPPPPPPQPETTELETVTTEAATSDSNQEQAEQTVAETSAEAEETAQEGQADPFLIEETPLPPPEPLPEMAQVAISSVLAHLLAEPEKEAEHILTSVRQVAYGGELQRQYENMGNDELPAITESLTSELRLVATQAGVAGDELDQHIAARQTELAEQKAVAEGELATAVEEEQAQLEETGQEELDEIAGAREAADLDTEQKTEAANGENDPELVRSKRDRFKREINRKVGHDLAAFTLAKGRREKQLDDATRVQLLAYRAAVQKDEREILKTEEEAKPTLEQTLSAASIRLWGKAQERELLKSVSDLKQQAGRFAETYRGDLTTAGIEANEMIEKWADSLLSEQESWWERIWRLFRDWAERAQASTEVWEEVRAGKTRDAILTDLVVLNRFATTYGEDVDLASNQAYQSLGPEQKAVIDNFYGGSEAGNPIAAVAAGIRVRILLERRPDLLKKFDTLLEDVPNEDWTKLEALGQTQNSSFNAEDLRSRLRHAMHGGLTGLGTDEDAIYAALNNLTKVQSLAVQKLYKKQHGISLEADLKSELSGAEETRAIAQLEGDQTLADVATLHEAMHGGITGLGTDEDTIFQTLRNKSLAEREAIIRVYKQKYGRDLSAELKDEMSGYELDRADALYEGDVIKADAIALQDAMSGAGTDEDAIEATYNQIRQDVIAEVERAGPNDPRSNWTSAQIEQEIARRNLEVEASFNTQFGGKWSGKHESALRNAFASDLSGPDEDLAFALADNDLIAADAARIAIEAQGILYTSDDVVNGVLESQYERALRELQRDNRRQMTDLRQRADQEGWDPYRLRDEERKLERRWEVEARRKSAGYMNQLEETYDAEYTRWTGRGGLQDVIQTNMSGHDREKAKELVAGGGYLSPARQLHYATAGAGTDEEAIRRALKGRSPEEIDEIRREWAKTHPGEPLDDRLASELSGRDEFDTNMLLKGEPRNAEEEMAQLQERVKWELDNSSGFLTGDERQALKDRHAELEAQFEALQSTEPNSPERLQAVRAFKRRVGSVDSSIEGYRREVDSVTDSLATAVEIAVVVTAAVVAGIFTGGTGTVGILAAYLGTAGGVAATALVAAGAGMAVRAAMKGDAYGIEDIAFDATIGIVDAAVSAATFGTSKVLLEAGEQALKGAGVFARAVQRNVNPQRLMQLANSQRRSTRIFAHAMAEGAEGFVSSFPTAIASTMLNDQTWEQGNPLANLGAGIFLQAGLGTLMGAGLGSVGGIRTPRIDPPPPRTGDLLARRGTPVERAAAWRAYKTENPDATMKDFLREFDAGVAQRVDAEQATQQAVRSLRGQMLSGLPPGQRGTLADVPMEILAEADFARLSRNSSSPVALVEINGQTRLIVREGANPAAVREQADSLVRSLVRDANGRPVQAERLLSRDLRGRVPVAVDPTLTGRTVRVGYNIDPKTGLVANIHMRVGLGATARDIELHVRTARLMRRYAGFMGRARRLIARARHLVGLHGQPSPGTRAWEAMLEVDKLPRVLEDRLRQLQNVMVDSADHKRLLDDIASLQRQLDDHERIMRQVEMEPGRGYVAAEDVPSPATIEEFYSPKLPPKKVAENLARIFPGDARRQEAIANILSDLHEMKLDPKEFLFGTLNNIIKQIDHPQLAKSDDYLKLIRRVTRALGGRDINDSGGAIVVMRYLANNQNSIVNGKKDPTFLNNLLDTFSLSDIKRMADGNPHLSTTQLLESLDDISRSLNVSAEVEVRINAIIENLIEELGEMPSKRQILEILEGREALAREIKREQIDKLIDYRLTRPDGAEITDPIAELSQHVERIRLQDPDAIITDARIRESIDMERRIAQLLEESDFDPDALFRHLHSTPAVRTSFGSGSQVYRFFRNKVGGIADALDESFQANLLIKALTQGVSKHYDPQLLARWKALHDYILSLNIMVGSKAFGKKRQLLGFIWEDIYLRAMTQRLGIPNQYVKGVMWSYHVRINGANFDAVQIKRKGNEVTIEISDAKVSGAPYSEKQSGVVPLLERLMTDTRQTPLTLAQLRDQLTDGTGSGTGLSQLLADFFQEAFGDTVPADARFKIVFKRVDSRE